MDAVNISVGGGDGIIESSPVEIKGNDDEDRVVKVEGSIVDGGIVGSEAEEMFDISNGIIVERAMIGISDAVSGNGVEEKSGTKDDTLAGIDEFDGPLDLFIAASNSGFTDAIIDAIKSAGDFAGGDVTATLGTPELV